MQQVYRNFPSRDGYIKILKQIDAVEQQSPQTPSGFPLKKASALNLSFIKENLRALLNDKSLSEGK